MATPLMRALYLTMSIISSHVCADSTVNTVDLIVYGDFVVTMEPQHPVIKDGALAVKQDQIIAIGSRKKIDQQFRAKRVIHGEERIVMPGLINGHTHSSMTLVRGVADDLELMDWLNSYIFPLENQFVNPEFVKLGTELACWEMIRGGTTTFVDMYFYPDIIADVVDRCGLRAIVASPMIDYPSPGFKGWEDSFAAAEAFIQRWQGKNPRIIPGFAPHSPYTVNPEHLQQTAASAKALNAPVSIHLAESKAEQEVIAERYQDTPVNHVANQGLLDTWLIGAHMVYPSTEEMRLLAKHQVGVIHNPTSNLKLASGIAPVPGLLEEGVAVGLGTDGAASNNDLDLWEEMRLAALLHKQVSNDPLAIPARSALELATSKGARAIGLGDRTGQLKVGMQADLIQVSFARASLAPLYNVISHLVYMMDASDVVTTVVAGQVLMEEGEVLTLDGNKLKTDATAMAREIQAAMER